MPRVSIARRYRAKESSDERSLFMAHDETRPLLVRMPADLHAAVKATAQKQDRTMAQVTREALRAYTKKAGV